MIIKDCPSYQGYSITSDGHVFTHRKRFGKGRGNGGGVMIVPSFKKRLNAYEGYGGYIFVAISTSKGQRSVAIHTLLADAFIGARPVGEEVRHLDGDRKNNTLSNLAYGTPKENGEDTARYGGLKGIKHPQAVLTEHIVVLIRIAYKQGRRICEIGRDFGINSKNIAQIVHRRRWTHVAQ